MKNSAVFPAAILNNFSGGLPTWWDNSISLLGAKVNVAFDAFVSAGSIKGWLGSLVSSIETSAGEPIDEGSFWRISRISKCPFDVIAQRGSSKILSGEYTYLGWLFGHYGHFLTESLSRFWYCLDDTCPCRFLVHANYNSLAEFPPHVVSALAAFGITQKNLTIVKEPVTVERLHTLAPALRCDDSAGLHLKTVYRHIAHYFKIKDECLNRKLYLSRSSLGNDLRKFNSAEIEDVFQSFGFEYIYPELFSFEEQVAMYASANYLAGLVGSGMHNAVFMPCSGRALILAPNSFLFRNDCLLSVGCGYSLQYFICDNGPDAVVAQRPWSVETKTLQLAVADWLAK